MSGLIRRLRDSVEVTRAEGTAALRYVPYQRDLGPSQLQPRKIGGALGRIDFTQNRCVYAGGGGWKLYTPALSLVGEPGEWELEEEPEEGVGESSAHRLSSRGRNPR